MSTDSPQKNSNQRHPQLYFPTPCTRAKMSFTKNRFPPKPRIFPQIPLKKQKNIDPAPQQFDSASFAASRRARAPRHPIGLIAFVLYA